VEQKLLFLNQILSYTSDKAQIKFFSGYLFYEAFLTELQKSFRAWTFGSFKPAFLAIFLYFLSVFFILKPA
jgi:hypothetical protein